MGGVAEWSWSPEQHASPAIPTPRSMLQLIHRLHISPVVNRAMLASAGDTWAVRCDSKRCVVKCTKEGKTDSMGQERSVWWQGWLLATLVVTMATQAWVKTLAIVKLYLIIKYETKEALRDNELFSRVISALRKLIRNVLWVNIKCIKICYKTCKTANLLDSHSLSFPSRSVAHFSFFSHVVITNCQTD